MNESMITFQGWLGSDVTERQVGQAVVATFRVASTPRRYNRQQGGWADGETNWYTVNAWRGLGQNCVQSLRRSDAVVVHGKLNTQTWTDASGNDQVSLVVEAISVGHDLNKGTAVFSKNSRAGDEGDDSDLRAWNATLGVGGPQVTSEGEELGEPAA